MSLHSYIAYAKAISEFSGTWPKRTPSFFYRLRTFLSLSSLTSLSICLFYNSSTYTHDLVLMSKSLYLVGTLVIALTRVIIMVVNMDQLEVLLEMLDKPSFVKAGVVEISKVNSFRNTFKKIQKYYWYLINIAVVGFATYPYLDSKPLPLDFPYFNNGTFHYPFYVFECMGTWASGLCNGAVDLLSISFITVAIIQLMVLNENLANTEKNVRQMNGYSREKEEQLILMYLKECCIHYNDIEMFVNNISKMFSKSIFMQLFTSILSICNSGVTLLTTDLFSVETITFIFYMLTMISELGVYCWFGNFVYLESLEVGTSCYMSLWYEHGTAVRKTIFILMERAKRPLRVTAIDFFVLSFETFITIMKWSYSYFTLLRNYILTNTHN